MQDDAGCETRVLQVKLLYGRVQGLEQELEQIVGGSDLLVKYVRDSADEKVSILGRVVFCGLLLRESTAM
jgi:hypothetical protein